MKKRIIAVLIAFVVGAAACVPLLAEEEGAPPQSLWRRLSLEVFGGFATLAPAHLNLMADDQADYDNYYEKRKFEYYHALYNDLFTYAQSLIHGSGLKRISRAFPLGLRAKLALNRAFSLSLGVTVLSRTESSTYAAQYDVRDMNPDKVDLTDIYQVRIEYPKFDLEAAGWALLVGLHAQTRLIGPLRLEGHAAAGPLFARCRAVFNMKRAKSEPDGFWESDLYSIDLKGHGIGVAVSAGLLARIPLVSCLDAFIEGDYAFEQARKIAGNGNYTYRHEDSNSAPYEGTSAWEGTWRISHAVHTNDWGQWNESSPAVMDKNYFQGTDPFHLDLSGFQAKVGLAWRF
jgi:hypothetical protein